MKLFRMVCCAGTLVGVIALGIAGCSSDDAAPAAGGTSGAAGSGGSGPIDCSQASGIAECKRRAAALGTCAALGDCSCDNCCLELADCETDPGCIAIRDCALSKGCRGIACYQAATCMDVIDNNGGPTGVPASYGTVLSTCLDTAVCPTTC